MRLLPVGTQLKRAYIQTTWSNCVGNTADYGGCVYVEGDTARTWALTVGMGANSLHNTAKYMGGVLHIQSLYKLTLDFTVQYGWNTGRQGRLAQGGFAWNRAVSGGAISLVSSNSSCIFSFTFQPRTNDLTCVQINYVQLKQVNVGPITIDSKAGFLQVRPW